MLSVGEKKKKKEKIDGSVGWGLHGNLLGLFSLLVEVLD